MMPVHLAFRGCDSCLHNSRDGMYISTCFCTTKHIDLLDCVAVSGHCFHRLWQSARRATPEASSRVRIATMAILHSIFALLLVGLASAAVEFSFVRDVVAPKIRTITDNPAKMATVVRFLFHECAGQCAQF